MINSNTIQKSFTKLPFPDIGMDEEIENNFFSDHQFNNSNIKKQAPVPMSEEETGNVSDNAETKQQQIQQVRLKNLELARQKTLSKKNEHEKNLNVCKKKELEQKQQFLKQQVDLKQQVLKQISNCQQDHADHVQNIKETSKSQPWKDSYKIVRLDGIDRDVPQRISKKKYTVHFLYQDDTMSKPKKKFVRFGDRTKTHFVDTQDINDRAKRLRGVKKFKLTPFDSRYWDVWILNSEKTIQEAKMKYMLIHDLL